MGMSKSRVVAGIVSAVFSLTIVVSVRADGVHENLLLEKVIYAETHGLTLVTDQSASTGYLYTGHFEGNNGKHLGFSMASVNLSLRPAIVRPQSPLSTDVTPNPEPATMVLLGTGLSAVAALARKRRKRQQ